MSPFVRISPGEARTARIAATQSHLDLVESRRCSLPRQSPADSAGIAMARPRKPPSAPSEIPRARRTFRLDDLSADDFEMLCFLVVGIEHREAVRFKAPDGGADSGLPTPERKWTRCWQSKRYTQQISWPKCVESLDAAVETYGMSQYTFCFARDLTVNQERQFAEKLVRRHPEVHIDYWNRSKIEGLLLTTAQGEAIANVFYEDSTVSGPSLIRALMAGGPIETGAEAFERLEAVADSLARGDPFYEYVTVTRPAGISFPSTITPGAVIAMEHVGLGHISRIEAVPRGNAVERLPSGTLSLRQTAEGRAQEARLAEFFAKGGEVVLEGVQLELRDLPPLFEEHGPPGGAISTVRLSGPVRPPLRARFVATTEEGEASLDISLSPEVAPPGWEALWEGTVGGLTVKALIARRGARVQMQMDWSYKDFPEFTPLRAEQLRFVDLLRGSSLLVMADPDGVRPPLDIPSPSLDPDPELAALRRFVDNVLTIQQWTGVGLPVVERIPWEDIQAIGVAAEMIRSGEASMNFGGVSMDLPRDRYEEMRVELGKFEFGVTFGLEVLGTEVMIGVLSGQVPGLEMVDDDTDERTDPEIHSVRLVPTTDEGRNPVFKLAPLPEPA